MRYIISFWVLMFMAILVLTVRAQEITKIDGNTYSKPVTVNITDQQVHLGKLQAEIDRLQAQYDLESSELDSAVQADVGKTVEVKAIDENVKVNP